jgi:hypothetical protein
MKKVSVVRSAFFIFNRANIKGDGRRKNMIEEGQVYVQVAKSCLQSPSTGQLTHAVPLPPFLISQSFSSLWGR